MASPSPEQLAPLLEKKATFQRGIQQLTHAVDTCPTSDLQALFPLVARSSVLLKTRYSSPSFWLISRSLFQACERRASGLTAEQRTKVGRYLQDSQEFLASSDVEVPPEAPAATVLADILQGTAGPRPTDAHYDDAGPIMDDEQRRQRAQGSAESSTSARTAAERRQRHADLQSSILEGLQAVYSGMEAVARGTEAVERELDAVLAALHDRHQPPPRPPASKKLVASLPRITVDDAQLDRLGRDCQCAVCVETLAVGDEVQQLPCAGSHAFHVACVAPWLAQNNSCPVCRTELPTDDPHYEAEKERKAEEERERRGAANALSHNEFAYI